MADRPNFMAILAQATVDAEKVDTSWREEPMTPKQAETIETISQELNLPAEGIREYLDSEPTKGEAGDTIRALINKRSSLTRGLFR